MRKNFSRPSFNKQHTETAREWPAFDGLFPGIALIGSNGSVRLYEIFCCYSFRFFGFEGHVDVAQLSQGHHATGLIIALAAEVKPPPPSPFRGRVFSQKPGPWRWKQKKLRILFLMRRKTQRALITFRPCSSHGGRPFRAKNGHHGLRDELCTTLSHQSRQSKKMCRLEACYLIDYSHVKAARWLK